MADEPIEDSPFEDDGPDMDDGDEDDQFETVIIPPPLEPLDDPEAWRLS